MAVNINKALALCTPTFRYYLMDRFNYEYVTLRFGYSSHFAGRVRGEFQTEVKSDIEQ